MWTIVRPERVPCERLTEPLPFFEALFWFDYYWSHYHHLGYRFILVPLPEYAED